MAKREKWFSLKLFLLLFFFSIVMGLSAEDLPDFTIMTEDWKPYQYIEDDRLKGITVDLMVLLLKEVGSEQGVGDIQMAPWARGYYTVQNKENTILFSMVRTPERESLFKWVGPIFKNVSYLIGKKSRNFVIDDPDEIKKYSIGTVYDDAGEIFLKRLGITYENMQRTNKAENNVKMMDLDRIDFVVTGWNAFVYDAEVAGINADLYEPVFAVDSADVNFAFHISTPDSIISKFQEAFDRIKERGELEALFLHYEHLIEEE